MPENAKFCPACGIKQDISRRPKSRGNGQGTVYQLPNKTWTAKITVGYELDKEGRCHQRTRSKSGFRTKKEALDYLPTLRATEPEAVVPTLREIYNRWQPTHKAGAKTMEGYGYAYNYFGQLENKPMDKITVDDWQKCLDDCPKGRRTKENMKALCGLLYKYAVPRDYAKINMAQYITVSGGEKGEKDGLPREAVEAITQAVGVVPWADYVLAHCYLGFRPAEFLALRVEDYNTTEKAFHGGAKTEAGKNRAVTVSPKIQPIIDRLTAKPSGLVFCLPDGGKINSKRYAAMLYSVLDAVGVDNPIVTVAGVERHKYTPHSCRHTFATLLKRVEGADRDKLELIGHTSTEMLRHYQDVSYSDLRKITDKI
jgi:integrase